MGQKANSLILRANQKNYELGVKYIYSNFEESTVLLYKSLEINLYIRRLFKLFGLIIHTLSFEYSKEVIYVTIFIVSKNLKSLEKNSLKNVSLHKKSSFQLTSCLIKNSLLEILNTYAKSKLIKINIQNVYSKFLRHIFYFKKNLEDYKKVLKIFRKFLKNSFLKEIFIASCISSFEKRSANFLASYIGKYFIYHKKRHNYVISFIKKLFATLLSSNFSKASGVKISIKGRLNGAPRAKTSIVQVGQIPLQTLSLNIDYFNQVVHTTNGSFGIKVWICYK